MHGPSSIKTDKAASTSGAVSAPLALANDAYSEQPEARAIQQTTHIQCRLLQMPLAVLEIMGRLYFILPPT